MTIWPMRLPHEIWPMSLRLTFSRFMLFRVESIPFTTPAIDLVTCGRVKGHYFQIYPPKNVCFLRLVSCKRPMYLVHGDGGLHSRCYSIHPRAHSQKVHRLILLSDGVLGVDPRHLHVTLLNRLGNNTQTHDPGFLWFCRASVKPQRSPHCVITQLTFFTLAFSAFSSLSHFFELRCNSLAANFRLNKFSVVSS